jgi:hypothetical protein
LFVPVLVLNLLLMASVMTEGAHYAVDMLSGAIVACLAIAASRSMLNQCSREGFMLRLPQPTGAARIRTPRPLAGEVAERSDAGEGLTMPTP